MTLLKIVYLSIRATIQYRLHYRSINFGYSFFKVKLQQYRQMSTVLLQISLLFLLSHSVASNCVEFVQPNQCALCGPGYYLTTSYTCLPCSQGCLECVAATLCNNLCAYGYFPSDGLCVPGPRNCVQISRQGKCTQCLLGYQVVGGECLLCPNFCLQCTGTTCTTCAYGFGPNSTLTGSDCLLCGGKCATCSWSGSQSTCQICIQSYYLNGTTCQQCPNECIQCGIKGCLNCIIGYFLNANICVSCPIGCLTCQALNECTACEPAYYLNSNSNNSQICSPCSLNCIECETNQTCDLCASTFFQVNGGCQPCGKNCQTCLSSTQCTICLDYYFSSGGVCLNCPYPCFTCQNAQSCQTCISNQFTPLNGQCISCGQALPGCTSCSSPNYCISCTDDYQLQYGYCQPQSNELSTAWIIVISISATLVAAGIAVGIYFFWRRRRGFMGAQESGQGSQLRATYYEIP